MAGRAADPDRGQPIAVEEALHTHYGVQLQQLHGDRGIVEVDAAGLYRGGEIRGDRRCVDLQPQRERLLWADAGADAAQCGPLDRLVQAEDTAPHRLVAERFEPEDLSPLKEELLRVFLSRIAARARYGSHRAVDEHAAEQQEYGNPGEGERGGKELLEYGSHVANRLQWPREPQQPKRIRLLGT
jgi:hypothetical protein